MSDINPDLALFDRDALHEARKRAVLQVAGRHFTKKGFTGTSLEAIAKQLKLTKAGLYHYVRNKEELLYLCYKGAIESAEKTMKMVDKLDCEAPEKISTYIKNHLAVLDQPTGHFIILSEFYTLSDEHQKELKSRAKNVDQYMKKLIEEGIREGSIAAVDPSLTVLAIQGALNWIPKWYTSTGKYDVEAISQSFIDFFNNGMKYR